MKAAGFQLQNTKQGPGVTVNLHPGPLLTLTFAAGIGQRRPEPVAAHFLWFPDPGGVVPVVRSTIQTI